MAVHYKTLKDIFHQMPMTILMGQPNTCKSLLAKATAALVGGLHRNAVFSDMSQARAGTLLGQGLFFVLNDPDNSEVLKKLITKVINCDF